MMVGSKTVSGEEKLWWGLWNGDKIGSKKARKRERQQS